MLGLMESNPGAIDQWSPMGMRTSERAPRVDVAYMCIEASRGGGRDSPRDLSLFSWWRVWQLLLGVEL